MQSNFDFLKKDWPELYESASEAEKSVYTAPRTCVFYSRYTLERAVHWLYQHDSYLQMPYQDTLAAMIHEQTFKDNLSPGLFDPIRFIHKLGNEAVHSDSKINSNQSLTAIRHLFTFLNWLYVYYSSSPVKGLTFNDTLIPKTGVTDDKTSAQLQKIQENLKQKDSELEEKTRKLLETEEELKKLREKIKEIEEIKQQNKEQAEQTVTTDELTEANTRKLFIDLLLREAGWNPDAPNAREFKVIGMPNYSGTGFIDYVLWGDNGLPLAVIEAKKTTVDPSSGCQQAKLYADCLEKMYNQRPIIFYSNGYKTWMWDDCNYPPREIQGFYKKDELQLLINRRKDRKDLSKIPVNKEIAGRYYQEEAIRRTSETFSSKAREALLVMATGTGKTRVAIAIVDLLMKGNWVKRVLFLADRTALLKQAKNFFTHHLPNVSLVDITEDKEDTTSRIAFSTYPTMMNCIDDSRNGGEKKFGTGHFDLIIIDEAHRSVYLKYKAIFEYFDSLLLGLTATPKADVDRNTYHLFNLENHVPTYAYELDQAVSDGYLVPVKAYSVPIKFHRQGIKYDELSEKEKEDYELTFTDEEGNMPDIIDSDALYDWLFNKDTVDKVISCLMEKGIKIEGGDKLGKTIIFARNHNHAEFIRERFDKNFPDMAGKFLRVIDNKVRYAQSLIDDFYGKEKNPFVAVSVDMLDTGIDVPEIVNLVFFKIVKSKAKFWQMIGRGTRTCKDLFGVGQDKEFFCIFDFCENFEFFNQNPEGYTPGKQESLSQKIFKKRLQLLQQLSSSQDGENEKLRTGLLDIMHNDIMGLNPESCLVRPHGKYVDLYKQREKLDNLSNMDIADLSEHLSHLPYQKEEDEFAKRFDSYILSLQLSLTKKSPASKGMKKGIVELAEKLEQKSNIPAIGEHIDFIHEIQTDSFWEKISLSSLELVRGVFRGLIKFLAARVINPINILYFVTC